DVVRVDLLRAIGPGLGTVAGSSAALHSLARAGAPFRTRFLLQAPAAELARSGDRAAESFLRDSLRRDPDAHVRLRAAEVAGRVPSLAGDLIAAVDDQDVRVREAALGALAEAAASSHGGQPPAAAQPVARRLASDPWTFVRVGAARSLAALPAARGTDEA